VNEAAIPKPSKEQAAAAKKAKRAAASEQRRQATKIKDGVAKQRATITKKLEELQRQSQGAKC
jgi:hypothetical protein